MKDFLPASFNCKPLYHFLKFIFTILALGKVFNCHYYYLESKTIVYLTHSRGLLILPLQVHSKLCQYRKAASELSRDFWRLGPSWESLVGRKFLTTITRKEHKLSSNFFDSRVY